jgi:hypothetical protein
MRCGRFEEEAPLALERGEPLEPHYVSCPDCAAAKDKYERLRAGLATVDEGIEAPPGFEARVWARIAQAAPAKAAAGKRPLWAGLAAACAVGIATFVAWPRAAPAASLEVEVLKGSAVLLGKENAHPGDVFHLTATTGTSKYAELRVYRAQRLVFRCSSEPPCRRVGDRLEAKARLEAIGRHDLVLLLSDAPLPEPEGRFDADIGAAARSGAQPPITDAVEAY